jgi:hypothetical protein
MPAATFRHATGIPLKALMGYKRNMDRIVIGFEKIVLEFADGSKTVIPWWLLAAVILALAGLAVMGLIVALATIRKLNRPKLDRGYRA